MNWIEALHQTYEIQKERVGRLERKSIQKDKKPEERLITPLLPLFHGIQNSHITVVLDEQGRFLRASVNSENDLPTIIPVTEDSESRSSGLAPYPLCDKLQYVAGDNALFFFPENKRKEQLQKLEDSCKGYLRQLSEWLQHDSENRMLKAIWHYIEKGTLIRNLVDSGILFLKDGYLAKSWQGDAKEQPPIFTLTKQTSQESAFIRWQVELPDELCPEVFLNPAMYESWSRYATTLLPTRGLCYITGKEEQLSGKFPKRIRNAGDNAKIISSNDKDGYTYRGRFIEAEESYGLSAVVSQKAHSALRWLLSRQGYFDGDQAILVWSPGILDVPSPCQSSADWEDEDSPGLDDASEQIAAQFRKLIHTGRNGDIWHALDDDLREQNVFLLSLDAASPGRLSITRYMEFRLSDYFENLLHWYNRCKWRQFAMWAGKDNENRQYDGTPSPRMIVTAAYGKDADEKLRRYAVSRILPSILLKAPIPADIEKLCIARASKKQSMHWNEWEMTLGVACSIYIYNHNQQETKPYTMSLDPERTDRSYLYGRLWAVAEELESSALYVSNVTRPTNAERLMQRFQTRPYDTWRIMESNCLPPYQQILKKNRIKAKNYYDGLLRSIMDLFQNSDFENDGPLEGAYLLGYHCQRSEIIRKRLEHKSEEKEEI